MTTWKFSKLRFVRKMILFACASVCSSISGFSQTVDNGKIRTYELLLSNRTLVEEVLTQENCNKKSAKCVVTIIDSTYYNQPKVRPTAVKESFTASFNAKGQPTQLDYSFKSNIISYDKLVTYSYFSNSVLIRSGYPPLEPKYAKLVPNHVDLYQFFLYTRSSDGRYESRAFWYSSADTTATATSREWIIKSVNQFDSIHKYIIYGLTSSDPMDELKPISVGIDSLVAAKTQELRSICSYRSRSETTSDSSATEKTVRYSFNESGKLTLSEIMNESAVSDFTQWQRDENNRLILYETTTLGKGLTQVIVKRNANGQPILVTWHSNTENLAYKFSWK